MDAVDDAAAAALWPVRHREKEYLGVLYGDGLRASDLFTQGSRNRAGGAFQIPAGSLRALFHNHPPGPERGELSVRDRMNAERLKVPSYISAGDQVFRYDPSTRKTEEVLAQIPLDEIRRLYLSEALNK